MNFLQSFISDHFEMLGFLFLVFLGVLSTAHRAKKQNQSKTMFQKSRENAEEPVTLHPEVDPARCNGCGACTLVCPEKNVLQLVNHKAVLVSPSACVGHGECEASCPMDAIQLVFGTKTRGKEIPRITTNYETNVPGLYIAGELGGMGLIRNAVKQGQSAAKHALSHLSNKKQGVDVVDLCVVGAGPAGIAAVLTAISEKASYICIDQNTVGGTVRNFPRQKLVMSNPLQFPVVGTLKFKKNRISKEELLEAWQGVIEKTGLQVRERTSFSGLEKREELFFVNTSQGVIKAKKVILAMGVRGTPRKLGLPNEDLSKVSYTLIEPEQYRNQHIAIVGAGNSAAEAAIALAANYLGNLVTLLVRGPALSKCNSENKARLEQLEKAKRVEILYQTSVKAIEEKEITISRPEGERVINNDFLLVLAGAEMPFEFLKGLGIQIEKKFGEALERRVG